jgi:hypothetical protein
MLRRTDAPMPYQTWKPFPDEAIVLVYNAYGDRRIAQCGTLWWGYENEVGAIGEGVITRAKRLDRARETRP